jgi:Tol biopolymer transport system component
MRSFAIVICAAACGAVPTPAAPKPERISIAVAERGTNGVHLVAIDESGDRQLELVRAAPELARDTNPAISPDGRWVVFASSRGRGSAMDETSLWIAPLAPEAVPFALTHGAGIDTNPTWTRDSRAIVYASTGSGGQYDLYELGIDHQGRAIGAPRRLTDTPAHEVTPTVAADGAIIYAALTTTADGKVESHLEERAPDGTITRLTDGPLDAAPALSPDGTQVAFARPTVHGTLSDADLYLVSRTGGHEHALVDLPLTDESGPAWSADGRFIFATSLLRGAQGNVVFASVIVIDTRAAHPTARILADRTGAVPRFTPAIAPTALDAKSLDADPEYLPELARITAAAIAAQQQAP